MKKHRAELFLNQNSYHILNHRPDTVVSASPLQFDEKVNMIATLWMRKLRPWEVIWSKSFTRKRQNQVWNPGLCDPGGNVLHYTVKGTKKNSFYGPASQTYTSASKITILIEKKKSNERIKEKKSTWLISKHHLFHKRYLDRYSGRKINIANATETITSRVLFLK